MNPMVPTISTPSGMTYEQSLYWGAAAAQLDILRNQMRVSGLNVGSRRVTLSNGAEIICNVCFNKHDVRVIVPEEIYAPDDAVAVFTGFGAYPRSADGLLLYLFDDDSKRYGVNSGGWSSASKYTENEKVFYCFQFSNHGFALYPPPSETGDAVGYYSTIEYGNLCWIGEDKTVLSWRGTPNRHTRVPNSVSIPSMSVVDNEFEDDGGTGYNYTVFGPHIYRAGSVYATLPEFGWAYSQGFVLGAAINEHGLFVIAYENRKNSPNFEYKIGVNGSATRIVFGNETPELGIGEMIMLTTPVVGGYPLVVYRYGGVWNGWTKIATFSKPKTGLPWLFNAKGDQARTSSGDMITITGADSASYTPVSDANGELSFDYKQGEFNPPTLDTTFDWSYSGDLFYESLGKAHVTLNSLSKATSTADIVETKNHIAIKRVGGSIDRDLGIVFGLHTLGIATFAEAAQVMPLVCQWTWNTPLLITSPYGDQSDPCNDNSAIEYSGWSGCGEYEWTATSNTGLVAKASGAHYRFFTVSTVVAQTVTGGNCECLNASVAYSKPTPSGRTVYTYVTFGLPSGGFINESDLMPGGAYRPTPIYQESLHQLYCEGVTGSCLRWYHTYHSVETNPPNKPAIGSAYVVANGRISLATIGGANIAGSGTCDYDEAHSCESLHFVDGYTTYDTGGNKAVRFYDFCVNNIPGCGADNKTPTCRPEGKHVCPNGTYSLSIADQCIYLGELPAQVYDANGNLLELPALAGNQARLICKVETQVCDPNGEMGG